MTAPSVSLIRSHILPAIQTGSLIMLAQTPFVTALNRISVVSCLENICMPNAVKYIYSGHADKIGFSSLQHFQRGVSGHLAKEVMRVSFKSIGITLKPKLDQHFGTTVAGKVKSDLTFATSLSVAEMAINPFDTLRTMWQAGICFSKIEKGKRISHLYKGSLANGARQFGVWLIYPITDRLWSNILKDSPIDPHSNMGIAVKSLPQSVQITTPIWIFERLKNELQFRPTLKSSSNSLSNYKATFNHILTTQGPKGFFNGFIPKVLSNAILILGANYLLEQGRRT